MTGGIPAEGRWKLALREVIDGYAERLWEAGEGGLTTVLRGGG
jgi:hypothetical protein